MNKKEDENARYNRSFYYVYTEFAKALAALEPLSKRNVVIRDTPNRLWTGASLFMKDASNRRWSLTDYELFFSLRGYGSEMVNNAREEIREDLAKIVELAKDIKRYSDDSLKDYEKVEHNAKILVRLQEVITPYLVARKLSE